jgi:hypothetical protein
MLNQSSVPAASVDGELGLCAYFRRVATSVVTFPDNVE